MKAQVAQVDFELPLNALPPFGCLKIVASFKHLFKPKSMFEISSDIKPFSINALERSA